jgi:site-specific DNA-methyltransferase (adenine-specific)
MGATSEPTRIGESVTLHLGDCVEVLRTLPACSVDAIVTDPPAGIAFMGKSWDTDKGGRDAWIAWMQEVAGECLRVIKPGGHALVWALPRTSHWTGMAWESAGWEPRDKIVHLFGTGFPKSLNVGGGKGTALKPAAEDWWLMRKPLDGTVAGNVLRHGTGALNIDGCRVATKGETPTGSGGRKAPLAGDTRSETGAGMFAANKQHAGNTTPQAGRWPANVLHDGSAEVVAGFPGEEARFFYCAKASRADREEGCDNLPERSGADAVDREEGSAGTQSPRAGAGRTAGTVRNHHPTVKNVELMRYLCRLITPPGGTVLDPFTGSGSTGKGAVLESFAFVGIERESDYLQIAAARIAAALARAPQTAQKVEAQAAPNGGTSILTETAPKATAKAQLSLLDSLDALDALDAL